MIINGATEEGVKKLRECIMHERKVFWIRRLIGLDSFGNKRSTISGIFVQPQFNWINKYLGAYCFCTKEKEIPVLKAWFKF